MPVNGAAENVLGTIGTICWTAQLVPQIWKSWREKNTDGLSQWLVFFWAVGAAFLGVYAVTQNLNIPLIIQPQLFSLLSLVSWGQCQYYQSKRPRRQAIALVVGASAVLGAFEAGMVFAIKPSYDRGEMAGVQFFGIASAVIIALALLPQYYEIYRLREVVGISILFMTVDCLGGVFSDLSLAFKPSFDIIAGVTYSVVVVMDALVVIAALILNPLARRRRQRERDAAGNLGAQGAGDTELTVAASAADDAQRSAPDSYAKRSYADKQSREKLVSERRSESYV